MHKILLINLTDHQYEVKTFAELKKYIGGVGIGLKLLAENTEKDPIIFSVGPLNGYFPYASKTSVVFHSSGAIEDLYLGGTLSLRIKFAGYDSILIYGKSEEPVVLDIQDENITFRTNQTHDQIQALGLPGKRSVLSPVRKKFFLDDYFLTPGDFLDNKLLQKNLCGLVITGTKTFEIKNEERYKELYYNILTRTSELSVAMDKHPSCSGCPMGCDKSRIGEIGGNILIHSLVACAYSENIYKNIGVIFSCLNILGYDYTHEDIEALPALIQQVLNELN